MSSILARHLARIRLQDLQVGPGLLTTSQRARYPAAVLGCVVVNAKAERIGDRAVAWTRLAIEEGDVGAYPRWSNLDGQAREQAPLPSEP